MDITFVTYGCLPFGKYLPKTKNTSQNQNIVNGFGIHCERSHSESVNGFNMWSNTLLPQDLSQQVQVAMENMLKMINEIDQNSGEVVKEIEIRKKESLRRREGTISKCCVHCLGDAQ